MVITCISDTHGQHAALTLPGGDLLIHAGDMSRRGREAEVTDFLKWFAEQPYTWKVFIAGNHDFFFERSAPDVIHALIPENIIYLNDTGTEINGIRIWGSPVTPWFYDWAFNRPRGGDIRRHWDLIPPSDIVITHGPVHDILDRTVHGQHVGCEDLKTRIRQLRPALHICGHIHEDYGMERVEDTLYINASVLDESYRMAHPPITIEFP